MLSLLPSLLFMYIHTYDIVNNLDHRTPFFPFFKKNISGAFTTYYIFLKSIVLVSYGYCNKYQQTKWRRTTYIYSLIVL